MDKIKLFIYKWIKRYCPIFAYSANTEKDVNMIDRQYLKSPLDGGFPIIGKIRLYNFHILHLQVYYIFHLSNHFGFHI